MGDEPGLNQGRNLEQLIPHAYEELRRIARARVRQLNPGGTLSATDLVNEVLLRLLKQSEQAYTGPEHLIRVAALAMHNVLVDRARRRNAAKRGGKGRQVEFDDDLPIAAPVDDMLAFHEACEKLRARSEEHFELVLLRVYAGLTTQEIATQRGQSTRTIERQWKFVKAVLHAHVSGQQAAPIGDK